MLSLILSLVLTGMACYVTVKSQIYASQNARNENDLPLVDIIQKKYRFPLYYEDIIYQMIDIWVWLYLMLFYVFSGNYILHVLNIGSIIFLIRGISINLTILPRVDYRQKPLTDDDSVSQSARKMIMSGRFGYKNDLLFSGHCSVIFTICLFFTYYIHTLILYKILLWFSSIIFSIAVIITKRHYTIDIFYAFIVSLLVFQNYNSLILQ